MTSLIFIFTLQQKQQIFFVMTSHNDATNDVTFWKIRFLHPF